MARVAFEDSPDIPMGRVQSAVSMLSDLEEDAVDEVKDAYYRDVVRDEFRRSGSQGALPMWQASSRLSRFNQTCRVSQDSQFLASRAFRDFLPMMQGQRGLECWLEHPINSLLIFLSALFVLIALPINTLESDFGNETGEGIRIANTVVLAYYVLDLVLRALDDRRYMVTVHFLKDLFGIFAVVPFTVLGPRFLTEWPRALLTARTALGTSFLQFASVLMGLAFCRGVEHDESLVVVKRKLRRIFDFMDQDCDGFLTQEQAQKCVGMLQRAVDQQVDGEKSSWFQKMAAGVRSSLTLQRHRNSLFQVVPSPPPVSPGPSPSPSRIGKTASALAAYAVRLAMGGLKEEANVDVERVSFEHFWAKLMDQGHLIQSLKMNCKRGNAMVHLAARQARHSAAKVSVCGLMLMGILSCISFTTLDTSPGEGLAMISVLMQRLYPNATAGDSVPFQVQQQVKAWLRGNQDLGIYGRELEYLELNNLVFCNQFAGLSCSQIEPSRVWSARQSADSLVAVIPAFHIGQSWRPRERMSVTSTRGRPRTLVTRADLEHSGNFAIFHMADAELVFAALWDLGTSLAVVLIFVLGIVMLKADLRALEKRLLRPLYELAIEIDSVARLQICALDEHEDVQITKESREIELIHQTLHNMKNAIRSWAKYVPWPVVQLLIGNNNGHTVKAHEKEVSIFFSDIASFTTIVEGLEPVQSLVLLSHYFQKMSAIIDNHGGIVLDFIGDAIQCIYNAPVSQRGHATKAVLAAVQMLLALQPLNALLHEKDLPHIGIRCGVHTGKVLVGTVGFRSRIKFGIVGAEADVAADLEELNKTFGTNLLISQSTFKQLNQGKFLIRPVDIMQRGEGVSGRAEPVYQVLPMNRRDPQFLEVRTLFALHGEAFLFYRHRNFSAAREHYQEVNRSLSALLGTDDMASRVMMDRCAHYLQHPPPAAWEGVWAGTL